MKIALVRPTKIQGSLEKSMVQHPINLCWIAAVLREQGHDVRIWDFEVEKYSSSILRSRVIEFGPRILGITSMTTNIYAAARMAGTAKLADPEILIVVGGPHASALPERTLVEFPVFDVAVFGEGEETIAQVAQRIDDSDNLEGVRGSAHREGGKIKVEDARPFMNDLDKLPLPARDMLNHDIYLGASTPGLDATLHNGTELFTTRGCSRKCIFCAARVTHGPKVRFRSADNVIAEIEECINRYGYNHFTIEDDTFTLNRKRLERICEGLARTGVTWDCDTRVDTVDRDMLTMMAESGCRKVAFGVESGSERMLSIIKKGITLEQVRDAFRWAHEADMITTAFFMIGAHPSETLDEVNMSLKLMKEIKTDLMALAIAVPHPGTELHSIMREKGYLYSEHWEKFNHLHSLPSWRTDHFSPEELTRLQLKLYRKFFFRPVFIWYTLKKAMSWAGIKYYTRSAYHIARYIIEGRV